MLGEKALNNVTLVVSNQCFDVNPVDIRVSIDGDMVVDDEFDVQGEGIAQHNWQRYSLQLPAGDHRLLAASKRGKARLETSLQVGDALLITLAFWCERDKLQGKVRRFITVDIGQQPVGQI
jgi:hypothetical protein